MSDNALGPYRDYAVDGRPIISAQFRYRLGDGGHLAIDIRVEYPRGRRCILADDSVQIVCVLAVYDPVPVGISVRIRRRVPLGCSADDFIDECNIIAVEVVIVVCIAEDGQARDRQVVSRPVVLRDRKSVV